MQEKTKTARQEQIERAAYEIMEEKGYGGVSMLAIARKARASNETLYNWYGDKTGLFKALVVRNAADVKKSLIACQEGEVDPMHTLGLIGPKLLNLLTSSRAIALNRAAAVDQTGALGAAIAESGRETVAPMLGRVLETARENGQLGFDDTGDAVDLFISLLVGDLQIRRVIGRIPPLPDATCQQRTALACERLMILLPVYRSTALDQKSNR